ncbi:MAG: hypothetical protein AB4042_03705, partial [Leptolyngbyaceae cyanobacterium]
MLALDDLTQKLWQLEKDVKDLNLKGFTGKTASRIDTLSKYIDEAQDAGVEFGKELRITENLVQGRDPNLNRFGRRQDQRAIALSYHQVVTFLVNHFGLWKYHRKPKMSHWETMEDLHNLAEKLLEEFRTKDQDIEDRLAKIEADSQETLRQAQTLPTVQEFQLATSIASLAREIQRDLDQGRSIMNTDPIQAWDHYGDRAAQIVQDSAMAMKIATGARSQLLTRLEKGDRSLRPFQVCTHWAHEAMEKLSQRLNQTVRESVQGSVADKLENMREEMG